MRDYDRPPASPAIVRLAAGWLAGGLVALTFPGPAPGLAGPAAAAGLLVLARLRRPLAVGVVLGWWLTAGAVHDGLADRLASPLDGVPLEVVGVIDDLPRRDGLRRVLTMRAHAPEGLPRRLRLSWYEPGGAAMPAPGERWRFTVRLRPPRGLSNPGGMDWAGWLLRAGIGATGYASGPAAGERVAGDGDRWLQWRGRIAEAVAARAATAPSAAVLVAVVTGLRPGLDADVRDALSATGTGHLLAISGLHVGLAAGLGALLAAAARGRGGRPRADRAALGAVAAALAYGTVAGWPVSARRAVLMLAAGLAALRLRRRPGPGALLALAWVVVLGSDPLALLDPGLWLSFGAVAAIAWALGARVGPPGRMAGAFRMQAVLSVAMVCLTAPWFGRVSVVSPLANLLAVPWFSLFVIPPALAGTALLPVVPPLGDLLLVTAGRAVDLALPVIQAAAAWPVASRPVAEPSPAAVACAVAGVAWLCLPRPAPMRPLAALCMLPLLAGGPRPLLAGEFELWVLDVGQGLSALVRTAGSWVVYDAGPAWPGGDAGRSTVVPALRALGAARLDALVLSHGDNDHSGGGGSVLAALPTRRVYAGEGATADGAIGCRAGAGWVADGVSFRFLAPDGGAYPGRNDASCVLLVEGAGGRVLLPGDVERAGEARLVVSGAALAADVVLAPHHGSRSSSGAALVAATRPAWVVYAAGWRNRWGFPDAGVVERWRLSGAMPAATDRSGALALRFSRAGPTPPVPRRQSQCRAWHDCGRVARP